MIKLYLIDTEESAATYSDIIVQKGVLLFTGHDGGTIFQEINEEKPDLIFFNIHTLQAVFHELLTTVISLSETLGIPLIALASDRNDARAKTIVEHGARDIIELPLTEEVFDRIVASHVKDKPRSLDGLMRNSEVFSSIDAFVTALLPLLSALVNVEKIALLMVDEDRRFVMPVGSINISPLIVKKSRFQVSKSLVKTISKVTKAIKTNKLFSDLRYMDISFEEKEKLLQMEADIIIPLHFMEEFEGILTLGKKTDSSALSPRELNDLMKVSFRICSFIHEIKERLMTVHGDRDLEVEMAVPSLDSVNKNDYVANTVLPPIIEEQPLQLSIDFPPEHVFADRFIVQRCLGKGGSGVVYLVADVELEEEVVLKIIDPSISRSEREIEAMKRDLITSRKASHRCIAPYFDFKEYEEYRYITMGHVPGKTLKTIMAEEHQLSVKRGLMILTQLCDAIKVIHGAGLVHGNLKPNNIIIDDEQGMVKLLDLGIQRPLDLQSTRKNAVLMETVQYISPEAASSDKIDRRSDIYSLGILLYQMFTGAVPFLGESPIATALMHVEMQPMQPRRLNTYLPYTIEEIILKCLQKSPADRYQRVEDIVATLSRIDDERSEGIFEDQFVAVRQSDQLALFLEKGKEFFEQGRFLDCIAEMKKVLSLAPQHHVARMYIDDASEKLQIDPSGAFSPQVDVTLSIDEIIEKATAELNSGDVETAVETIRAALKMDSENKKAINILSTAQKKILEEEVRRRKENEKQRARDIKQLWKDGKQSYRAGEYETCIECMEKILALDPLYSSARKLILKAQKYI